MKLIIDSQYFANSNLYKILVKCTHIGIVEYDSFRKMSFRNRCLLASANGRLGISVPLENGRHQKQGMKEVRIDGSQDWQSQHWKTISACYNRSPWFEYYKDSLEILYRGQESFLIEWNRRCLEWSMAQLGWQGEICFLIKADMEDPILAEEWTDARGLANKWPSDSLESIPAYHQVFEERTGFMPQLSILDLLFCTGPQALDYLKK